MNSGDATQMRRNWQLLGLRRPETTFETLKERTRRPAANRGPTGNDRVARRQELGFLLQVYPNIDVWVQPTRRLVQELRTCRRDRRTRSTYEYTTLLKQSYQAALYAIAAMAVLVLLQFRSLSVLLAHVPVLLAAIWLTGYFNVRSTPNIMTLPAGIGVTFGVRPMIRGRAESGDPCKSTGKAVFVSDLTTVAGFGA
jgi:hypothetical protein